VVAEVAAEVEASVAAEVVVEAEASAVAEVAVEAEASAVAEVAVIEVEEEEEVDPSHQSQEWLSVKVTQPCYEEEFSGEYNINFL